MAREGVDPERRGDRGAADAKGARVSDALDHYRASCAYRAFVLQMAREGVDPEPPQGAEGPEARQTRKARECPMLRDHYRASAPIAPLDF